MLYFAYGSNMSLRRIAARIPSVKKVGVATLKGYRLAFHKKGKDGSAKCDVIQTGESNASVLGVLYDICTKDKSILDEIEGVGKGYELKEVFVFNDKGEEKNAFLYVASVIDSTMLPYNWYKEHVLRGAKENKLPSNYIREIEAVNSIKDPNLERHQKEMGIYSP
ncbi:gamma-glutamylcyclotransferase family protein [Pleionea sp. CnH1-48]|uniref:gamma-glutamylcyclotransferase family protein n=1 Tax=Pleionea sp. CnH1-48 TaxID=2954494 RepID=UPI0020973E8D|nr:gamma-glutamylcyclotransferase family protein [Pleionea sp. CnH1-48]MCO7224765.1 gamma-glutamylcyclotransferase [Pleionea sp. CnH1-48]